ncbi:MAG: hypothetical protein ACXABD_00425 [Candidatus Thorarchaeota archaeon]|jgi:hypothetical protein
MAQVNDSTQSLGDSDLKITVSARKTSRETIELKKFILQNFPQGIDHGNTMEAVISCVRFMAESKRKLTGQQKKKLIVDALLLVLDETDSGILESFEPLIKNMIPTVVDNLIDVEKGKIKLNKGIRKRCCFMC